MDFMVQLNKYKYQLEDAFLKKEFVSLIGIDE